MVQLSQSFYVQTEQLTTCPNCQSMAIKQWCQSPERSLGLSQQVFTYSQCQNCYLIFLSERPIELEINKFYPANYQPYQSNLLNYTTNYLKTLKNNIQAFFPTPLVKELKKVYSPKEVNQRFLDFGCGSEVFLNYARDLGWKTIGLDFSKQVIEQVQNNEHQTLLMSSNVWNEIDNGSLNLVRMSHVLEHLYNPLEVLKNMYLKMAKNSTLHIMMPNAYGLSARIFRSYWWGLECPRHIMFYSPHALQVKLAHLGFSQSQVFYENITKDMARSIGYMMYEKDLIKHETVNKLVDNKLLKILLLLPLQIAASLQIADRFHIFAKKI